MSKPGDSAGRAKTAYPGIAVVLILVGGCGAPTYFRLAGNGSSHGGQRGGLFDSGGTTSIEINTGSGAVSGGMGGMGAGDAAMGDTGTGGVNCAAGIGGHGGTEADARFADAEYTFETTLQSWKAGVGSAAFASVSLDQTHSFAGQSSLAGSLTATRPGVYILEVDPAMPTIPPAATITFHVYVPDRAAIAWIQPYVQDTAFVFTGVYADVACLARGGWSTLTLKVPAGGAQVGRLGVQVYVTPAWTGTVYVDSVGW